MLRSPRSATPFGTPTASGTRSWLGVTFDHTPLQPIAIADADGRPHTFRIRSMLVATGHEMEALEITHDQQRGYCFRVPGELETDAWELFRHLHANMRREMARRHVESTRFGWQLYGRPASRRTHRVGL